MDKKSKISDETGNAEAAPAIKKRRPRRNTFGTRITVSYRFPEPLHEAMINFCADNSTPINTWMVGIVEREMIAAGYTTAAKLKAKKSS